MVTTETVRPTIDSREAQRGTDRFNRAMGRVADTTSRADRALGTIGRTLAGVATGFAGFQAVSLGKAGLSGGLDNALP